jgi:acyl carrier protein
MKAMGPGLVGSRKAGNLAPIRREFLFRAGALAVTAFLAQPLRALALSQAAGSSAQKPEEKPLTVEERVKKIIVEHLGVDEKEVVPAAKLADDLGADSLDVVELSMAIEEAFDLQIPDKECVRWKTVADVVHFVQAEVAKKQPAPAPH